MHFTGRRSRTLANTSNGAGYPGAVCIATCLCKHAPIVRQAGLGGRKRLFRLARIAGKGRRLLACSAVHADRKSVVSGKMVEVRVVFAWRRIIKKNKN